MTERHRSIVDVHLIVRRDGRILLGRRADTGYGDGLLHLPSGHLEAGESVVAGAIREAAEEIGIVVRPADLRFVHVMHRADPAGGPDRIGFFFEADRWSGDPVNAEPAKCSELVWADPDTLPADVIPYPAAGIAAVQRHEPFALHGWPAAGTSPPEAVPAPPTGGAPSDPVPPVGRLAFRPLTRADFPLIARWLAAPHVATWWCDPADLESVAAHYGPSVDGTDPTRHFVIEEGGRPVGFIQCYRHADEPDWDRAVGIPAAAGIDYLIGEPDRVGKGVGSRAIRAFVATVLDRYPEVAVVVAVPQAANMASRRALERAGFTLVEERDVESDHPGDAGPSAIYALARPGDTGGVHRASAPAHGPIDSSGRPEPDPRRGT